jgi:hypothetical protein
MIGAGIKDADPDPEEGDGSPSPELGGHGGKKRDNIHDFMKPRGADPARVRKIPRGEESP